MATTILRLPETIKRTGKSRSSIYLDIKSGSFPKPIKLGARSIGFVEQEIDEWIEKKIQNSRKSSEVNNG